MADTSRGGYKPDIFDEREKAFEAQYRREEEIAFKAEARCAHLFGLWAAGRLGLEGTAAETYARAVIDADLLRPNHLEMLRKVATDLAAKGIATTELELQGKREMLIEEAKKQLLGDLASGKQNLEQGF
ncbi:MAG TPA: DUF1476 domain-containing protein [Magnetospirillaceae bacterium]|jgi:hypothetical protein